MSREEIMRDNRIKSPFQFLNRQTQSSDLVILVCGYKQVLWPYFFGRLEKFVSKNLDVCIVCPGFKSHPELEAKADKNGWSILLCHQNKISIAINLVIKEHPHASFIHKLDEDIIICKGYFERMSALLKLLDNDNSHDYAFAAPLINVNGYSYHRLLRLLGKTNEYESQFGTAKSACMQVEAWSNPKAASYLWDLVTPIDKTATELFNSGQNYSICPHRFSIGAMLFHRSLWEDINYFEAGKEAQLGIEEKQLAEFCSNRSQLIAVSEEVLAGHFSFGPQYEGMLDKLNASDAFLRIQG
ncbi:MAG: hypothetical protein JXR19_11180 [Bacteroidia bacterium]